MTDFVKYVVSELKSKRLSKTDALGLIMQFSRRASLPAGVACLHPLLHRNTSDLTQQCYATDFSGDEFFLRDHRIQGRKVLPGVAYLEMARAAVALALPAKAQTAWIEIRNVAWAQPIVFPEHREVSLALFQDDERSGEQVEFEVYSADDTTHFQGSAVFRDQAAHPGHDLVALTARMTNGRMDGAALYPTIAQMGIDLGPAHQGVKAVLQGEQEMLVEIVLPDLLDDSRDEFVLHPSVLDSAVQAGMALVVARNPQSAQPPIPFALESLRVFGGCDKRMFAWVRYAAGSRPEDRIVKLDIDLCSADGKVRAQMLGFSSRVLSADIGAAKVHSATTGCLLAVPTWTHSAPLTDGASAAGEAGAWAERHIVLCDMPAIDAGALSAASVLALNPAGQGLDGRYTEAALACFDKVQAILASKPHGRVLVQVVVPNDAEHLAFQGLSGLLGTAAQENPKLIGQLLFAQADIGTDALAALLQREACEKAPNALVKYEDGQRSVLHWQALEAEVSAPVVAGVALRESGVYLITGGLGGLGRLFAREILAQTRDAKIVLTGRAEASADIQTIVDGLDAGGTPRVHYRRLDLCDPDQVAQTVAGIVASFGQLNGILHSAGAIRDNFILKKTAEEIRQVFGPKVAGTVHLDHATRDIDLDFFVLFSSAVSVFGNAGQADYAAASGFMDGFAASRNRLAAAGKRHGAAVSINWPLWQEGGMGVDAANQAMLEKTTGMQAMQTANGLQAFYRSVRLGQDQLLVVEGDLDRMRQTLLGERSVEVVAAPDAVVLDAGSLFEQAQEFLRKQFAEVLKLAPQKIDPQAPLERYGIDSILAMDLTTQLEITFGSLPKTLFFEYQSIHELTAYFVRDYPQKLADLFAARDVRPAETKPATAPVQPAQTTPAKAVAARRLRRGSAVARTLANLEPIAIVGLSGRYPESENIEVFWENLRDGKDCIIEIPKDRWDWQAYFNADRTSEGNHYSKWGGFISGVDEFDPLFFNIPPVDAELIDPQERLFLQHAWMAVEDAGYTRASLQRAHQAEQTGQVGVYVGVMYGEYQLFGAESSLQGKRMGIPVSYASIANRVSYILNLHGPSMTLDTMCSSSLTAIHLACQDLKQGRTHLAIAGGVNVSIHPNKYLILSAGQFISSDGHCQSFGEGGDGYIPGEGVGAAVLKRLSDAERDGNHIYGVIKGSALNHGGKTNGYSVPNPKAQAVVIDLALKEYGTDARHVSYIEAHGTGTKLGDPIEIAALNQVFRQYTKERQFCALGSAKSNIGHCESAAGIAALTKVLLQMKHRMIVPSLHSSTLNPNIDFEASPFVVNQTLREWVQPEIDGKRVPRIAGISSFGAGGSNAHLIIEEAPQDGLLARNTPEHAHAGVVIPLSARTHAQLKRKAEDLLAFVNKQALAIDLHAMAYTLQVGREAMDMRLAFVVDSVAQLAERLDAYCRGEQGIDQCFSGQVEEDNDSLSVLSQDEDMREAIDKWIARKKFAKLAELWVAGLELDWRKLNTERKAALISLPTYPFARDRYWVSRTVGGTVLSGSGAARLHPLVHANTSDFFEQRYTAEFSGDEFFLADHQIDIGGAGKRKILPGVAYLEMVRAAVELALPPQAGARRLAIRNVAWAQPIVVDSKKRASVVLWPNGEHLVDFEVQSSDADVENQAIHCQGQVDVSAGFPPERRDIVALQTRMAQGALTSERLYDAFRAMGIHYGPAFRCVAGIAKGQGELLAELRLPGALDQNKNDYALHPSLLDSALQAAIGLVALDALPDQPSVPFALDSIALHAPCSSRMYAWVRYAAGGQGQSGIQKIDIDLCDQDGNVCAILSGLASRTIQAPAAATRTGLLLARPRWEPLEITPEASTQAIGYRHHRVLLCELSQCDAARLSAALPGAEATLLPATGTDDLAERYRLAALACFETLQTRLKAAPQDKQLFQLVIGCEGDDSVLAGLTALIDTARLENPNLIAQVVLTERGIDENALAGQLRAAATCSGESLLTFVRNTPSVRRWDTDLADSAGSLAYKDRGVYLITGGLGGLGGLFAREILTRTEGAVVVLSGRSGLSAEKRAAFDALAAALSATGGQLHYRQLELNALDQVQALVSNLVQEFGALNGVFHSAGMTQDAFIIKKTADEFAAVLAPKVLGTAHLDAATQHIDLDFMVLFSSVSSAMGNAGQADYAAANGFMDRFAAFRNRLVAAGQRRGKTRAINWPLWEEGGMQIDAQTREWMQQASGMQPMKTASGMQALNRSLELDADQILVIEGDLDRLRRALQNRHAPVAADVLLAPEASVGVDASLLLEKTQRYLSNEFASLFRMPAHEVDPKAPLEKYGMDSVLAMKLTNQLERSFGSLSKTLFFEYQTIASLAGYLVKAFPDAVREKTGMGDAPPRAVPPAAPAASRALTSAARSKARLAAPAARGSVEIAIVGVSGRYPFAKDLNEFWENLKQGRDCITEIPADRWDHTPFFEPGRNKPGKSYAKWGGFLAGVDQFDALFFSISPKEAELIDPQERLFIETVWETIEDAGYSKDAIARNRVGVYVGVMWGQYELYGTTSLGAGVPSSSFASVANRVSYFFNFQGPSLALDTMCSSSLTAIHLASEALRNGGIDVAIAGGVNVSIHPAKYLGLSQGNFASTDGRCRSFGQGGDGYVPGEGVGAVLLKPLDSALRDGDQIYAVLKASAINHGGKTNGYTVPNPIAQSDLILDALKAAKVAPETLSYIETHGTGTSLGDPIEMTGLVRAFEGINPSGTLQGKQFCPIGSVKSNIGHLESAAGIAAVTKVLLQFKHRQLVPSLHAEPLNPHIDFQNTPFYVQTALEDWVRPQGHPRRAGVSSFGAGGSNAHLILEEFDDTRRSAQRLERSEAFVLSARNRDALLAYAGKMIDFLDQRADLSLADIAFTAQVGRTPMQERLVVIASDTVALRDALRQWMQAPAGSTAENVFAGNIKDAQSGAVGLIDGEAGSAFLQLTLENRDLAKLAKLWVSGVDVDWAILYRAERPRRISLPTYPFARERYWIETTAMPETPAVLRAAPRQMLYYRTEWRPAPQVAASGDRGLPGPLLVLGADDILRHAIVAQFKGATVVAVQYGDGFRHLGEDTYCVAPASEDDFARLLDGLKARNAMPASVIHFVDEAQGLQARLDRGVFALHGVCRALLKQKQTNGMRIVSVQQQGTAEQAALHCALAGYLKSLTLENPKFSWKVLLLGEALAAEDIARGIADECGDANWREREVRYRAVPQGGQVVLRREVKQTRRFTPDVSEKADAAIKQNGVYIVTGGLGGLGYLFSEHLAKRYGAKLVLTGRSPLDAAQQAKLAALKACGGDAVYVQADVADPAQAETVVREAKACFSRISGVIHSAGVHHDAFVLNKTQQEMASVLAAKVMGTLNLDRATQNEGLDLFVLFSSVAGAFGNLGQCDYAYANNFMDAFAEQRQAQVLSGTRSGQTLSINWPFWEEGGMRITQSDIELMEGRSGISPLPTKVGIQYWDAFLQSGETQGIALYGDPAKIEAYLSRATQERVPADQPTAPVAADAASLREATENYLSKLLSEEIKLPADRIDSRERFESFGVDSMMISRINASLERDLGELPKTLFYEYASIEELAGYLIQNVQPALVERFGAPVSQDSTAAQPLPASVIATERATDQRSPDEREGVAIIGVHGAFPRSESMEVYWRNLREGRDLVDLVPETRWDLHEFFDADPENAKLGKIYCKWGGFLEDFDKFDAAFFSVTPDDARMIDPQERLFIQSVWAAVEDAGYTRDSLKRHFPKARSADVGVFVGVTTNSYQMLTHEEWTRGNMVNPGSLPWSIANRVSYFFDFLGPSMPIDTACSSALVAIHLACESLKKQECQVAIAGGVNLYLHPSKFQSLCRRRMLAVDGKCRSFGEGDDGFIPGEGVGTVVLKPLARAIADRDYIYGVVAASASEHSGRSNGYSAPNPNSQAILIEHAMNKAGIDPETIGYVEGHGTGTQLGDSLEVVSLTQAFRKRTQKKRYCPLGSVKANIGHLESAAGIAGVAKILMQFKHRELAPTLHSEKSNPNIDFDNSPFYLQHKLSPWEAPVGHPRRAMINSFGAGGVNSCLILEDYQQPEAGEAAPETGQHLVVLSAKNSPRLQESAARLRDYLEAESDIDLGRLSYTLQVGREAMDERLAVIVANADELLNVLTAYADGKPSPKLLLGRLEPHRRKKSPKQEERALAKTLFNSGNLETLAQMWIDGNAIEWDDVYGADHPFRLPLPTYPFARERYWVSDSAIPEKRMSPAQTKVAQLHPLVSHNVSTLKEVCFASTLSGNEYYGQDHMVNGEMFFPGAGFLEIACVNGAIAGEDAVTRIEDIVWIQPLRLTTADHQVKTFLKSNGNDVTYATVSFNEDNERVLHSEGRVCFGQRKHADALRAVHSIKEYVDRATKTVAGADSYRQLERFGFRYGPCFQTIQELHAGDGFALSRLKLADVLKADFEQYILHPCLIDGALQTVLGVAAGSGDTGTPYLPFAMESVEILRPLSQTCFALAERAGSGAADSDVKQFNIQLLSESGEVLVKLNGFYVRALRNIPAPQGGEASGPVLIE